MMNYLTTLMSIQHFAFISDKEIKNVCWYFK
jgi:hypothetical protein